LFDLLLTFEVVLLEVVLLEVVLGFDGGNLVSGDWNCLGDLRSRRDHHPAGRNECSARQRASQHRTTVDFHHLPAPCLGHLQPRAHSRGSNG